MDKSPTLYLKSSISLSLEVQSCIKNELSPPSQASKKKRVKTNGQAWDIALNFALPGDDMSDYCVAKFQTHPVMGSWLTLTCDQAEV